jgi:hypothetical protein
MPRYRYASRRSHGSSLKRYTSEIKPTASIAESEFKKTAFQLLRFLIIQWVINMLTQRGKRNR